MNYGTVMKSLGRALVAGLSLSLLFSGSGVHPLALAQSAFGALDSRDVDALFAELDEVSRVVREAVAREERGTFDPRSVVFEVGLDWQALASWVEQEVAWVPYHGLLRGAKGVLLDRRGNSLDQAVLLAELMDLAGFDVRLARTQLSAEIAEQVLAAVLAESLAKLEETEEPAVRTDELVERLVHLGADSEEAGVVVRDAMTRMESITTSVHDAVAWQSDMLADALDDSLAAGDDHSRFESALRDHWWVQVNDGMGEQWRDVDVVLGGHLQRLEVERLAPVTVLMPSEIPEEHLHRVEVRVVSERWADGQYNHDVLMARTFDASGVIGVPISVSFVPLLSLTDDELEDEERVVKYARETQEWLPVVRVGSDVEWDKSVELSGRVNDSPNLNLLTQRFGQAARGLGALGLSPTADASHLTAVWIEYVSTVPGFGEQVVRRERFDRFAGRDRDANGVPTEAKISDADVLTRGLMLLAETTIMISASWLTDEYVRHLASANVLESLELVKQLIPGLVDPSQAVDPEASQFTQLSVLPVELLSYQLSRDALGLRRSSVYIGRPNIVSRHDFAVPSGDRLDWLRAIDIVVNDVEVLPSAGFEQRLVRLEQGVLDSIVEVLVNEPEVHEFDLASMGSDNAASLLAASSDLGVDWVLLTNPQAMDDVGDAIADEIAVRIQEQLRRGSFVFAPTSAVTTGSDEALAWWSIDPVTGTTLSIGPRGWGSDVSGEYLVVVEKSKLLTTVGAATWGAFLFCAFIAATVVFLYAIVTTFAVPPAIAAVIGLFAGDGMKKAWVLCLAIT